jgi:hypothetical protein
VLDAVAELSAEALRQAAARPRLPSLGPPPWGVAGVGLDEEVRGGGEKVETIGNSHKLFPWPCMREFLTSCLACLRKRSGIERDDEWGVRGL